MGPSPRVEVPFLAGPRGFALLAAARETRGLPPHRRPGALASLGSPEEVRAALAQDDLRRRAERKTPHADRLLFSREALEQATPWEVAVERAGRWPAPPERVLHDLGAGLGTDAIAVALAGRPVVAWERDEERAAILEHNAAVLGVAGRIRVERRDFRAAGPSGDLAFLDPDRRPSGRRTRRAEEFEPPASEWPGLLSRFRSSIVKAPPSGTGGPEGAPFELVSLRGDLRERRLFFGEFGPLPARRALRLPEGTSVEGSGAPWPDPVAPREGDWLLDPDPGVTVAGLVGDLALREGMRPVHPRIAYLVGPRRPDAAPGVPLRVDAVLPARRREIDAWLAARGVGRLEIRSRGVGDDPETWRRRLHPRGDASGTLVFLRDPSDRWTAAGALSEVRTTRSGS